MEPIVIRYLANNKDEQGNVISYEGSCVPSDVKIEFRGKNNVLQVADGAEIEKLHVIFEGGGGRCILGCVGVAQDYPPRRFNLAATIGSNSIIEIGDNTTTVGQLSCTVSHNYTNKKAQICIGRDCMFASDIKLMTTDRHVYFDTLTLALFNKEPVIVIGDHVWIGVNVLVLSGSVIGEGSIIGARAVVKGRMPNNCTIAGNPAVVRRQNVAWERLKLHYDNKVSQQYYNTTQPSPPPPRPSNAAVTGGNDQPLLFRMFRRAWGRLKKIVKNK